MIHWGEEGGSLRAKFLCFFLCETIAERSSGARGTRMLLHVPKLSKGDVLGI